MFFLHLASFEILHFRYYSYCVCLLQLRERSLQNNKCTRRAVIGQYSCLDQSIQTQKNPANYCGYFIKEIPNGSLCLDNVIQTLGMLLDFRKAKNTRLAARVFLRFSQVSQHPACLDHFFQTRKTIRYFFISLY